MDVRSFNVTPVSHLVKAAGQKVFFFFKKSFSICNRVSPKKKNFKHDEQKGWMDPNPKPNET